MAPRPTELDTGFSTSELFSTAPWPTMISFASFKSRASPIFLSMPKSAEPALQSQVSH